MSDKKQQDTSEGSIGQSVSTARLGAKAIPRNTARWISCDRKMPKEGETVLAFWYNFDGKVVPGCFGVATYWPGHWHNPVDDEDDYCDPTHWMPLPEAPNVPSDRLAEDKGGTGK